ncbi:MAG: hypothetical protein QOI85_1531 [Chloroflexota bacterium]|jgi:hypothetical protein|nr:hypothetical protein [Chloroflexota bacterium]
MAPDDAPVGRASALLERSDLQGRLLWLLDSLFEEPR